MGGSTASRSRGLEFWKSGNPGYSLFFFFFFFQVKGKGMGREGD
jgi:hypothetical protein